MFEHDGYQALFRRVIAVRSHRADFLEELGADSSTPADLFERAQHDPVVASMKVLPALEALPEVGKVQTRRALEEVGVAEDALIGAIQADAANALPDALARHAR